MFFSQTSLCLLYATSYVVPSAAHQVGDKCQTHTALAGEYIDGPVTMNDDPLAQFDTPMVKTFNSSTSEVWAFDAGSHDGKTAMVIYLSRGTVASNTAAQRALISVSWPNGTRQMENVFLNKSTVTVCPSSTTGTWTGVDGNGKPSTWLFEASKDLKQVVVDVDSAKIQGRLVMKNTGKPLYPGGLVYPNPKASVMFAPEMYWQEHFPVATASANFTINGNAFSLSGVGGRDKNWLSRPWAVISKNWDMARAAVGPYGVMFWRYTSAVDGRVYLSATLMEHGNVVFRTTTEFNRSDSNTALHRTPYCSLELTNNGSVHLSAPSGSPPPSRHTGYTIDLVSAHQRWQFVIDYSQTTFWFPASESLSVGQFVGIVKGGLMGSKQHQGVASGSTQEILLD